MAFIENNSNGLIYMSSDKIGARHAFTTRYGGVSTGGFYSLNLGSNRGDDPEAVRENYRRVCALMGAGIDDCAVTKQVHGTEVRVAEEADVHRFGTDVPYEADGLVTAVPGLALACFTADCVPVLLCDDVHGVIGAVHCGWRSSVGDILGNAVEKMCALGASTEHICAAVGPAIGKCCFEVGGEVIEAVDRWLGGDGAAFYRPEPGVPGKFLLDLQGANACRLRQLGLRSDKIAISDECTMCAHDKYWSHRYTKGRRGTQGALIVL